MEIARVIINGNEARAIDTKRITKGMRGATIRVTYADPMWDSLTKLVVFEGATEAGFLHEGEIVEVPPKVLAESGGILRFGVCGKDADSAVVIPTVWAELGQILSGVPTDINPPSGVAPSLWMQILGMIGDLMALETETRDNLVAAINEVLAKTGTGGTSDAVQYIEQALNEDQQMQARANLGLYGYRMENQKYADLGPDSNGVVWDCTNSFQKEPSDAAVVVEIYDTEPYTLRHKGVYNYNGRSSESASGGNDIREYWGNLALIQNDQEVWHLFEGRENEYPDAPCVLYRVAHDDYGIDYSWRFYISQDLAPSYWLGFRAYICTEEKIQVAHTVPAEFLPPMDAAAGGYYIPSIQKLDESTAEFTFTPSADGMAYVEPVTITLPGSDSGQNGDDGATFTPSVSADGVLSWTNDKGLDNPDPVNIKGQKGDPGTSVTVKAVSESTADGGSNMVAFSDGKTVTIKNGNKGSDGKDATVLLAGKKIVYDGDSICESRLGSTANNGGGYAKIIANIVGGTYVNNAVSGAALTSTPSDKTYHSVVDGLTALPTDGDLYCFEGGYNDFCRNVEIGTCDDADYTGAVDTSTICGAMEKIFRYCLSVLIGRPVCFVISHKCNNTQSANSTGKTFKDYRNAMIQVCEKYSIPYYDAFTKSGLNGWNAAQSDTYMTANANGTGDGTHPNEQGYKRYYVPQLISLFESMMPTEVTQSDPGVDEEPIVNLIDTVGYTDGVRLSTTAGNEKTTTDTYTTTGFIKMESASDIYRTSGVVFDGDRYSQSIVCVYDANQAFTMGGYIQPNQSDGKTISLTQCDIVMDGNGNLTIKPTTAGVGCYFKLSGYGYGENLIVTKNQEIT